MSLLLLVSTTCSALNTNGPVCVVWAVQCNPTGINKMNNLFLVCFFSCNLTNQVIYTISLHSFEGMWARSLLHIIIQSSQSNQEDKKENTESIFFFTCLGKNNYFLVLAFLIWSGEMVRQGNWLISRVAVSLLLTYILYKFKKYSDMYTINKKNTIKQPHQKGFY